MCDNEFENTETFPLEQLWAHVFAYKSKERVLFAHEMQLLLVYAHYPHEVSQSAHELPDKYFLASHLVQSVLVGLEQVKQSAWQDEHVCDC